MNATTRKRLAVTSTVGALLVGGNAGGRKPIDKLNQLITAVNVAALAIVGQFECGMRECAGILARQRAYCEDDNPRTMEI
ncbi:MAG: hypothetical protein WBS22_16655 [Methylocystis sp.]